LGGGPGAPRPRGSPPGDWGHLFIVPKKGPPATIAHPWNGVTYPPGGGAHGAGQKAPGPGGRGGSRGDKQKRGGPGNRREGPKGVFGSGNTCVVTSRIRRQGNVGAKAWEGGPPRKKGPGGGGRWRGTPHGLGGRLSIKGRGGHTVVARLTGEGAGPGLQGPPPPRVPQTVGARVRGAGGAGKKNPRREPPPDGRHQSGETHRGPRPGGRQNSFFKGGPFPARGSSGGTAFRPGKFVRDPGGGARAKGPGPGCGAPEFPEVPGKRPRGAPDFGNLGKKPGSAPHGGGGGDFAASVAQRRLSQVLTRSQPGAAGSAGGRGRPGQGLGVRVVRGFRSGWGGGPGSKGAGAPAEDNGRLSRFGRGVCPLVCGPPVGIMKSKPAQAEGWVQNPTLKGPGTDDPTAVGRGGFRLSRGDTETKREPSAPRRGTPRGRRSRIGPGWVFWGLPLAGDVGPRRGVGTPPPEAAAPGETAKTRARGLVKQSWGSWGRDGGGSRRRATPGSRVGPDAHGGRVTKGQIACGAACVSSSGGRCSRKQQFLRVRVRLAMQRG